jgi:hypothetical protein
MGQEACRRTAFARAARRIGKEALPLEIQKSPAMMAFPIKSGPEWPVAKRQTPSNPERPVRSLKRGLKRRSLNEEAMSEPVHPPYAASVPPPVMAWRHQGSHHGVLS